MVEVLVMSKPTFDWDGRTLTFKISLTKNFIEEMQRMVGVDPDKEIQKIVVEEFTVGLEQWMANRKRQIQERLK